MRTFGLLLAIFGAMTANAVTFVCFANYDGSMLDEPQIELEDPTFMRELGEETAEIGFTFDGYGRDDEMTVFEEESDEPIAGLDFASNANWEISISLTSDFAMISTW